MKSFSSGHIQCFYLLSGVLLGVGFIFPLLWISGILGVALFAYTIKKTSKIGEVALGGFIAWTAKSMLAVSWFWAAYPIEWINLSLGKFELPVIGFYWITVSIFLSLGGVFIATAWWFLNKHFSPLLGLVILPVLWVLGEVLSSAAFSFFTLGKEITVNTLFSFGYLGYLLGNHELLLLIAKFGGVYVLSFTAVLLGYLFLLLYETLPKSKSYTFISLILLGLLLSGSGLFKLNQTFALTEGKEMKIAIVDTRFGDSFFEKPDRDLYKKNQIGEAVAAALNLGPKYIILPENSQFTPAETTPEIAYRFFRFQSSDSSAVLIDSGSIELPGGGSAVRAVIYDGVSKKGWAVDKQYLVPQGEFMPYLYSSILNVIGMKTAVKEISNKITYRPGPIASQVHLPAYVPGLLFCFESADPYAVRRLLRDRKVPFIAHPISHSWFHESEVLWHQFDLMLKIQALWNKTPIVSAGNMVHGALYTKDGEKIQPTKTISGESWQVSLVEW